MERQKNQYSKKAEFDNMSIEQKILDRTSRFKVPEGRSAAEALSLFKTKISEEEKGELGNKSGNLRIYYWISSAAAVILLLLGIWQLWKPARQTSLIAGKGSHHEYKLPDGSVVSLNSDSKITYSAENFSSDRQINLEGEAFFNIVKGNPFIISTVNGSIKVLGTTFNVYTRNNLFKVSCLTGKVLVSSEDKSVQILPGESAEFSGEDLLSFHDDNIDRTTGWLKGEFYYENSPLNMVFEEIERQFNVKFEARNLSAKFFTGSFNNQDLDEALDIVCIPMGLKYEIGRKGKIFITEI